MRKEAAPTKTAHGRGDMPQTDQVDGDYMEPVATDVKKQQGESLRTKYTARQIRESIRYWERQLRLMESKTINEGLWDFFKGMLGVKAKKSVPDMKMDAGENISGHLKSAR